MRIFYSRRWWWTTLLVLTAAGVMVRLGFWQLDRLESRRAFNAHVIAVQSMPSLDLTNVMGDEGLTEMEYRAATAQGIYDFDLQVALRNQYWWDQYGYHLLTPLVMADGSVVIVDRGWIPAETNATPQDWRKYDRSGEVLLHGIIRLSRARADMGGVADPELLPGQTGLSFWNNVNLERISAQLLYSILPVYLQLDPQPELTQPPYPHQPEVDLTEGNHLGYALQWFSYAALLLGGYPIWLKRQRVLSSKYNL